MARVPDVTTPVSSEEIGQEFLRQVPGLSRSSLRMLIAHWAGETGWGRGMHCWNVGNAKSSGVSGDWCFFSCTEVVPRETAIRMISSSPGLVSLEHPFEADGNSSVVELRILPDHPWSRFAAYSSLSEGVAAYLAMMQRNFPKSWASLLSGDPSSFVSALKSERYFTASVAAYQKLFDGVLAMVDSRAPNALAMAEGGASSPLSVAEPSPVAVPRFH